MRQNRENIASLSRLAATILACAALCEAPGWAAEGRKPNIVIILVDDLGYHDLGCQGDKEILTPNIDAMASCGVRCTHAYTTAPVGGPVRAALLTGRYSQRFGNEFNPGPQETAAIGIPSSERTLAEVLKPAGYATAAIGKWHIGTSLECHPLRRGFDEFFGFLGAAHYLIPNSTTPSRVGTTPAWTNGMLRGDEPWEEKEYLTDAFSREAVSFIDRSGDRPFLLYLAYNAPHSPIEAPPKYLDRLYGKAGGDERWRVYGAMIAAIDDGVGQVQEALKRNKLLDDTLIVFTNDNGGITGYLSPSSNAPFIGAKSDLYEGGVRVPFLAHWSGHIPAGITYDQPVSLLDIFATATAAAGVESTAEPKLDGVNLVPHFNGEAAARPHETLYWRYGPNLAARHGRWKFIREQLFNGDIAEQLFDMSDEDGELRDVSTEHPEVAARLKAEVQAWSEALPPATFGTFLPPPWW